MELDSNDIWKCYEFAEYAWTKKYQSQKHFGGTPRNKNQFMADQIEGKLAECALKKFLKEQGLSVELDFNHYEGQLNTDNGDISLVSQANLVATGVDIKGSSHRAAWLLIEDYKFKSKVYVMVRFSKPFPGNKALRENPDIVLGKSFEAEAVGWAKHGDFYNPQTKKLWFEWAKGSKPWVQTVLPDSPPRNIEELNVHIDKSIIRLQSNNRNITISIPLDAKCNYGLPIKWLRKDWKEFVDFIQSQKNT